MRVVMIAVGSAGDVHPFVGLGRALKERAHDVVLHACGVFRGVIEGAGVRYGEVGTEEAYHKASKDPDLWHPRRGFPFVMREAVLKFLRPTYEALREETRGGDAVLVASTLDLAARVLRDKEGVPLVTTHLAPACLRSCYRAPVFKGAWGPRWTPKWQKRLLWWFADRIIDPAYVPQLNAFRNELGLRPVHRPLNTWWNSPDLILGLFPEWFGPRQPDWPAQLRLAGFPQFDASGQHDVDQNLQAWIEGGDPPIVFTAGTAMVHGEAFFAAAAGACAKMGRRGLLLSQAAETIPQRLPDGVRHEIYVPFSEVLPKSAALVSHGGIGTCAQALAAGIPHLVAPLAHDQFDNASRLKDLGVGAEIARNAVSATRLAAKLRDLLGSDEVARRCREIHAKAKETDALERACREIEAVNG